jgi:hypothetical protein
MNKWLIAIVLFLSPSMVRAQVICSFTPTADANNTVCANTAFVHKAIGATNPMAIAYTAATLPTASASAGTLAYVTDGTSGLTWGQTITGGHSTPYLVWSNGTNWTVIGE